MGLLEYENQMFLDAFHEDGLLITARGLGLERIFASFLKLYSDAGNLVLVLNTTSQEEEYYTEILEQDNVDPMPKPVTSDISVNHRRDLYLQGGVLYVTSRILVVDMLTERIPIEVITGIIVYKAHKIIDSCQEAFILRLYRQKNKKGFVKAFSDSPLAFTAGFCHVERVMKSLFVRKLFLWPRFQASVVSTMDRHKVDVVELYVQLTPAMQACQTALLDLIDACIKELKRCNITLDTDEFTVENAMTRNFDKIVRLHLDPVWHQLGPKTKQLVTDIKTLRLLLEHLTQFDCVNFFNLVNSIRSSEKQFGSNSGWLFMDAADSLFVHAKDRVVMIKDADNSKKQKTSANAAPKKTTEMVLEECPKWRALKDVLSEIEQSVGGDASLETGSVLIIAQDDRTCTQLKNYLCEGGEALLKRLYDKTQQLKSGFKNQSEPSKKGKGSWKGKGKRTATLTQIIDPEDDEEEDGIKAEPLSEEARVRMTSELSAGYVGVLTSPCVLLHPMHGTPDPFSLQRVLKELQPTYVVMYDADIQIVRILEVFRASRPGKPLRVYFIMYEGSTEEQRYLTSLRKEKQAFEYLIFQKGNMVIPEEREGKDVDDPELSRDVTPANATTNTRKAGGSKEKQAPRKVVVDMREFRSELPSLIHRRGIDIEPVTIEVGDYILTPDICVERKSVSDLIGSLNNGRLYNQCVSMCRHYARPVLLIEFDPNKSFALQGKYQLRDEINSSDVISRLALLILHFPRLRIFWCQSPYATAELFEEVKAKRAEPDGASAIAISGETDEDISSAKYNHRPQALLLKMPGVNSKNVAAILNKVEDIAELTTLSVSELSEILGSEANGRKLHGFLHKTYDPTQSSSYPGPSTSKGARTEGKARKPVFHGKRKR